MGIELVFLSPLVWLVSVCVGNANLNPYYIPKKPFGCPFCLSFHLSWLVGGGYWFVNSESGYIFFAFIGINPFISAYLNHKINQWL